MVRGFAGCVERESENQGCVKRSTVDTNSNFSVLNCIFLFLIWFNFKNYNKLLNLMRMKGFKIKMTLSILL